MFVGFRSLRRCALALAIVAMSVGSAIAQPGSFTDLGVIGGPGSYVFNTDNSFNVLPVAGNCDTELGLWDNAGLLIAQDDDGSALNFWSEITESLTAGTYYLGIGEFDSIFGDNFVNTGTSWEPGETSDVVLNINGSFAGGLVGASDQLDQETAFFSVTVVPEPSMGVLGLLGIVGLFVKRRR